MEAALGYWRFQRGRNDVLAKRSPPDITIDAVEECFGRIRAAKPANTGVPGAESTLTALLGELAIAQRAEVS